ncbi:MAG: hypothetical protein ACTSRP_22330 [Candidatus Helarchaeota archaeon]
MPDYNKNEYNEEDKEKLKEKFIKIFTEENWIKLEEDIERIKQKFHKQIELDEDTWNFVINE